MKRAAIVGLLSLGLTFLGGTVHAEIFKWVDANGKVHYSDKKPMSQAQKINVNTGATTLGNDSQDIEQRMMQQQKYVNYLQSERLERQEKRQQAKQKEEKNKKLCATMQDQLRGFSETNYRWYDFDEVSGKKRFLSDDQIEVKKKELEAEIKKSNC